MNVKLTTHKRMIKYLCLLIITLGLTTMASAAGSAVVANATGCGDSISKADLQKVFLGKTTKWPDGTKIVFVVLKKGDAHNAFLKDYIGKTSAQFKTFWKKQVFTGKGKAPKSFTTEEKLLAYVAKTKGAVGYVSTATKDSGLGDAKAVAVK